MSMLGGQPSITTPIPPPCDSPNVVTRKSRPNVLPIWAYCSTGILFATGRTASLWGQRASRLLNPDTAGETPAYPTAETAVLLDGREGELQIVDQIAHVFHADR